MQMRMMDQSLAPGVENSEEADFGAEMFGIAGDLEEGFGSAPQDRCEFFAIENLRRRRGSVSDNRVNRISRS